MDVVIKKVYVINMKHRQDRWRKINQDFKDTSLRLDRWEATNGKELTDKEIKEITTMTCYNLCSPGMIGCWLSHYRLWKYIAENNLENVLILEDDAYPVKNFDRIFLEKWSKIPDDWDFVFLGCGGTGANLMHINLFAYLFFGRENKFISDDILIPAFALRSHAYIISRKGAEKLVNDPMLKKISYSLDFTLSRYMLGKINFKMYSITEELIKQHDESSYSDIQKNIHPLISNFASKIKIAKNDNVDTMLSTQIAYIRKIGVTLTIFNCLLLILSTIVGFFFNNKCIYIYFISVIVLYFIELISFRDHSPNFRELFIEIILIVSGIYIGKILRKMLGKNER